MGDRKIKLVLVLITVTLFMFGCNRLNPLVGNWELVNENNPQRGFVTATGIEIFSGGTGRMTDGRETHAITWTTEKGRLSYHILGQFHILDYNISGGNLTLYTNRAANSFAVYSKVISRASSKKYDDEKDFGARAIDVGKAVEITGYVGSERTVRIPSHIEKLPVTTIGERAFRENQLTSVTIPNKVTTIGDSAFSHNQLTSVIISNKVTTIGEWAFVYNQLTKVIIPNSVTTIGEGAFYDNQLTKVTIPNRVTEIGRHAFCDNQLTSVTIGSRVTTIGEWAFASNLLTKVTIPNRVTEIGGRAFFNNKLTSLTIGANVTLYDSIGYGFEEAYNNGGKLAGTYTRSSTSSTTWTRGGSAPPSSGDLQYIDTGAAITITCYIGTSKTVNIPERITGKPVTAIDGAFYRNQLTSVVIPNSVTEIGRAAFASNQLTSVTIPNSVITIGDFAFASNQLTSVTIGANVTLGTGDYESFDNGFDKAYDNGGKLAGTYTRSSTSSTTWTRQ